MSTFHRSPRGSPRTTVGLLLTTTAVLALELLQMRLLSFMLWHHLAYMVISMVLLGLGAGGVWMSLRTQPILARADAALATSATLAGVTSVLAFCVLTRIELDTFQLGGPELLRLALYYGVLIVPYFFAGLVLSIVFTRGVAEIGRLYFVDLIGSALGAVVFYFGIGPLGAPTAFVLAAALLCLGGVVFALDARRRRFLAASSAALVAVLSAAPFADELMPARPAATKALAAMLRDQGGSIAYSRWTPISRIDVVESEQSTHPLIATRQPGERMKAITIDGDATTWMWKHEDVRSRVPPRPVLDDVVSFDEIARRGENPGPRRYLNNYHAAFLLKEAPDTLIIGAGGGNEVFTAHQMGAAHVTGVELNPTMLAQSLERYAEFVGHIYQSDKALAVVGEGRSYVRHAGRDYDIIQMSGVDTWSGLSSGAYVLSENYLYTVEAFVDFLRHLEPDGILCVGRWRMTPPRECLRLVSVAGEALRELGVLDPRQHVVLETLANPRFVTLLVKRSPFLPAEIAVVEKAVARAGGAIYAAPGSDRPANGYQDLVRAYAEGREREFFDGYPYDVTPVRDDQPFFFEYYKWGRIWKDFRERGRGGQVGANMPVALAVLGGLLLQALVLSGLLILVPLHLFRRRGLAVPGAARIVGYFTAIGLAFMFVEIVMMQRFVLFLGHPAYSIPVVLVSLLVSAGVGSLVGSKLALSIRGRLALATVGVAAVLIALLLVLPFAFDRLLGAPLGVRITVSAALLAVPGFLMGMPFPLGLSIVSRISEEIVPWAWGINGVASVLGAILVILIAMGLGFTWALVAAALLYLLAPVLLWRAALGAR